jgi:anti-anti-sigma factor
MNIEIESIGKITLLIPRGRLDFGAAAGFQAEVEQALTGAGRAPTGVLIDCAELDYVSSAGLRVFLIATRAAKRTGVAFAVCSLTPAVKEVFAISGFGQLVSVHADRALAIARMPL